MADAHIDQDEMLIYGSYAADHIRRRVVGLVPAFDAALTFAADGITQATATIASTVGAGREADAQLRQGAGGKRPALVEAIDVLVRFGNHLDGHKDGTVDKRLFFTANGTASGVGRGALKVLQALDNISTQLAKSDSPVKSAADWKADVETAANGLRPHVTTTTDARTTRRSVTPEVAAASAAWHRAYLVGKDTTRAVLRQLDKLGLLDTVFFDLAVPSDAKVTDAPSEPAPPITPPI